MEFYANQVIDCIDREAKYVKRRMFRESCQLSDQGVFVKNLKMLGPGVDLSKVVIVDNTPENFSPQKENGLQIKSWHFVQGDNVCR